MGGIMVGHGATLWINGVPFALKSWEFNGAEVVQNVPSRRPCAVWQTLFAQMRRDIRRGAKADRRYGRRFSRN